MKALMRATVLLWLVLVGADVLPPRYSAEQKARHAARQAYDARARELADLPIQARYHALTEPRQLAARQPQEAKEEGTPDYRWNKATRCWEQTRQRRREG
jgi:hypothetical protein